ncbi:MAG: RES family NAD+ phosphorylase [Gammaproteobacteria bacterium]|nr:RES family NAD+ phosphorylase [Gammaproteobacteria bacterium]MDD9963940.1 RES family NAD+ phosphorylase [Gammaproteobacteria bacterium]
MILWRISNHADLGGLGGVHRGGRWHSRGVPVVYLSESPALAFLEVLVNFEMAPDELPVNYQLLEVECSAVSALQLNEDGLSDRWEEERRLTQGIGDKWLASGESALLRVPSAVVPESWNYLFNPRHPAATRPAIRSVSRHPLDRRLRQTSLS